MLDRLQADLADLDERRPLVLLVQPSGARQVAGLRGKASAGLHIGRRYERSGFDVVTVEDPTPRALMAAIGAAVGRDQTPAIVHLSGGLRESSGGIAIDFLASDWDPLAADLPVTALHQLLSGIPRGGARPVVVLDVDRPANTTDAVSRMLLRNAYAGELFALGGCAAVLATGLTGSDPYRLYEPLTDALGAGASIGEATTAIRRQLRAGEEDLEYVLPHGGVALFTHLPWLRLVRRAGA